MTGTNYGNFGLSLLVTGTKYRNFGPGYFLGAEGNMKRFNLVKLVYPHLRSLQK
jgi:hypothetical protein